MASMFLPFVSITWNNLFYYSTTTSKINKLQQNETTRRPYLKKLHTQNLTKEPANHIGLNRAMLCTMHFTHKTHTQKQPSHVINSLNKKHKFRGQGVAPLAGSGAAPLAGSRGNAPCGVQGAAPLARSEGNALGGSPADDNVFGFLSLSDNVLSYQKSEF